MDFGQALVHLKDGKKIKRAHWGGYWTLFESSKVGQVDEEGYIKELKLNPTIFAVLKNGGGVTVATPYQEDILADDWEVLE